MASPFPGMDPYLEKHWGDVQTRLVTYTSDQLQERLPSDLRARVEERVVLECDQPKPRPIYPDVRVERRPGTLTRESNGAAAIAVAEPLVIDLPDESETQRFVEIRESKGGKLVTVLEVLSPTNKKPGDGREQYLRKQRELIEQSISLVEIDLLRAGEWVLALPDWVAGHWPSQYRVAVRRGWDPAHAEYYPIFLDAKLPAIKVPLRKSDEDVPLDLQALIEKCYHNGAYDDLDYAEKADPPLAPKDSRWADRMLRKAGRRIVKKKKRR